MLDNLFKIFLRYIDMNQEISIIQYTLIEDNVKKILLKLSKDISIHGTLRKNEVSCYKFWVDYN